MRKTIVIAAAIVIVLMIGALAYIPLSSAKEICKSVALWGGSGTDWQLDHPMGLAWNDGFLYVADAENGAVKKLSEDGRLVADWKGFKRPVAIAVAAETIYVADFLADQIVKLNPEDGTVLARWGRHGNAPGEFDAPSGIGVDASGFIYIAEFYNHRIQKLTSDGVFVKLWGTGGRWNGQFHYPTDVAVSPADRIVVADAYNHRVEVFTADGSFVDKWGGVGYGVSGKWAGWFRWPKQWQLITMRMSTLPTRSIAGFRNSQRPVGSLEYGVMVLPSMSRCSNMPPALPQAETESFT